MSIVPISCLSSADLFRLGNNVRPRSIKLASRRRRKQHLLVAAVNRSLAAVGERVATLHRPLLAAS